MSVLRVGLVGCGGRGTGAAHNCVTSAPNVSLVAMGEIFPDRLQRSRRNLAKMEFGDMTMRPSPLPGVRR